MGVTVIDMYGFTAKVKNIFTAANNTEERNTKYKQTLRYKYGRNTAGITVIDTYGFIA